MTTARFYLTGSRIDAVEVSEHAGYAEAGEDIVCAAVSANLDLTSCLLEDVMGLAIRTEVDEENARIRLELPSSLEGSGGDTGAERTQCLDAVFYQSQGTLSGFYRSNGGVSHASDQLTVFRSS